MAATTPADVTHLWRRAAFGIDADGADARAGRPWGELVAELVDPNVAPMPTPAMFTSPAMAGAEEWMRLAQLVATWIDHMASTPTPGAEKLTWFWHNHFTTVWDKVMWTDGLHRQLTTLRSRAQGAFRALLGDVVVDSAMSFYLDNVSNTVGKVNENFGRELLELYTVGAGNFTEADVVATARSLTGHNVDWGGSLLPRFYPTLHDQGSKTVLGVTANFDAPTLCDTLCSGSRRTLVARHVTRRLWSAWAYSSPSSTVVNAVANTAINDGFTGRSFARAVLLHPEFRSARARTELVRTPLELVVASARAASVTPSALDAAGVLSRVRHMPYMPPNVSGWGAARNLFTPATWWELGAMQVVAVTTVFYTAPGNAPATAGLPADAAAREALRWAGVVDPAADTVADVAAYLASVRASSPASEAPSAMLAATLSPDFAAGGGT